MIADALVLTGTGAAKTFTLVSRVGMESIRRQTNPAAEAANLSSVTIKHTLDDKQLSKPNRHLIAVTFTEIAADGTRHASTAHCVITRSKGATNGTVKEVIALLADFLSTSDNIDQVLIGGN